MSRTRFAALAIAVVVLVAAVLPCCASACCVQTTTALRMMAAMKCCKQTPTVQSPASPLMHPDATLTAVAKITQPALAADTVVIAAIQPIEVSRLEVQHFDSAPTTSAFLRNEQFRI